MENKKASFAVNDCKDFKIKMLNWSSRFNIFCFLDNNNYASPYAGFDCMLAAGCKSSIQISRGNELEELQQFSNENNGWLFGHFGYDVLSSKSDEQKRKNNEIDFGDGFFFIPEIVLCLRNNELKIESETIEPVLIFKEINGQDGFVHQPEKTEIHIQAVVSKKEYIDIIDSIKRDILRGDCYELNFCQQFFAKDVCISPLYFYQQLTTISPNPFAAFYKLNDKYCLCASPERFLKKKGTKLISQPIKGTSKRNVTDALLDAQNKNYLLNSDKEKSENVMVVDLVRNDLSKICTEGSVKVTELFGVYSFPQVHQMISTIEGSISSDTAWTEPIKACFPMGSMTGAPKIKVMELIEKYEQAARGLFSGSIGYVNPERDFDFNVVIRSLFYDASEKRISFYAGGGITFNSEPEKEYEECLLKAAAIINLLKAED